MQHIRLANQLSGHHCCLCANLNSNKIGHGNQKYTHVACQMKIRTKVSGDIPKSKTKIGSMGISSCSKANVMMHACYRACHKGRDVHL